MRRIVLTVLLGLTSALQAQGAGVFDGSTSDLVLIDSATPIDYPVFMACFYKPVDATHRGTLIALSDDGAGGSLDCLALEIRGDAAGDRIHATSTAAGSSSAAATTTDSIAVNGWKYGAALFESAASRHVRDGAVLREETTTRAVGNWTHLSIGALYDGGATNRFNGRIADARVWFGTDAEAIVSEQFNVDPANFYDAGYGCKLPSFFMAIRPDLYLHQSLLRAENDYMDWGPSITNNGVTFDFGRWQ